MTELQQTILETVTDANPNQWNNVVEQSDLGCLFHRYEWLRACEEALDLQARHVVVSKGNNPVAVLPNFVKPIFVHRWHHLTTRLPVRRLVSIEPGTGGPVVTGDEEASLELLFDGMSDVNEPGVLYHSVITNDPGYVRYGKQFAREGYEANLVNCRFLLDLRDDWDDIRENMHKSRRQGLRRAEDADVDVRVVDPTPTSIREMYDAYVANMARIDVTTFQFAFFERLYELLDDRLKLFVAEVDGEELGRQLCLLDDERAAVHYYFSGIPTAEALDYHPAEALHAAAIRWASDRGYDYYDFGATGSDFTDGVFRFKHRFGADPVPSLMWQAGRSRVGWPAFKLARSLYRRSTY